MTTRSTETPTANSASDCNQTVCHSMAVSGQADRGLVIYYSEYRSP